MSTTRRVCDAAPRNYELLSILLETQHAVRDLGRQVTHIAHLEEKLVALRQHISLLDEKRESDLKRHKSYRDSVVKKFAYRLSGQSEEFAARAQKGQQDYFDVLQQEHHTKEEEHRLLAEKVEAIAIQKSLEEVVKRRANAQHELDVLYDSIFHGPTLEFPEEDELEERAEQLLNTYHCAALRAENDRKLVQTLTAAREKAAQALNEIVEALSGGSLASTPTEKKRLEEADLKLKKMHDLVAEAKRISPAVSSLPSININIKILDGEAYGNPWGRMAVHDRMREWRSGAQACLTGLDKQLDTVNLSYAEVQTDVKTKLRALSAAKEALQLCRTEIFAIVESAEVEREEAESPPPY